MSVKDLQDFIAKPESGGDFNIVWGGIKAKHHPPKPLVKMTIGEVLDWQDSIDRLYMSEASGAWQIMEDTLRGVYEAAGLTRADLYNETNQRRLCTELMNRRGLQRYLRGEITGHKFGQSLSKEWASLPCIVKDRKGRPAKGQSYYAGDGLNKSHVSIDDFMTAVGQARVPFEAPRTPEAIHHADPSEAPQGIMAAIMAFIAAIFGGKKA